MLQLLFTRDAITSSARTRLAHRARSGELARVAPGAYVQRAAWAGLDPRGRFLIRVRAAAGTAREPLVLCRAAAAAVHGLPWLGPWPARIDVLVPADSPSRSSGLLHRHRESGRPLEVVDGLTVTALAATAVDIARGPDFARAVVVADAAVARGARMGDAVALVPPTHGAARVRAVVAFADGRSGSPGEWVSRVTMRVLGVDPPDLQRRFANPAGGSWSVDFWWPEREVIGEFDGDSKYLDPAMRGGRDPARVLLDEKRREDALRRASRGFIRWDWPVARDPRRLAERLALVGIVPRRPRTFL